MGLVEDVAQAQIGQLEDGVQQDAVLVDAVGVQPSVPLFPGIVALDVPGLQLLEADIPQGWLQTFLFPKDRGRFLLYRRKTPGPVGPGVLRIYLETKTTRLLPRLGP